jgi:hypothetical protein
MPDRLIFRIHALRRMFERSVSRDSVRHVIMFGEVIEDYPNEYPYPSKLILGWVEGRPLHVVAAENSVSGETIVITVYEPESSRWDSDFRRRI